MGLVSSALNDLVGILPSFRCLNFIYVKLDICWLYFHFLPCNYYNRVVNSVILVAGSSPIVSLK